MYYEFCKCIEIFFNHTTFSSIFIHYSKSVVSYSPVFPFAFSPSCKAMSTKSRRLYSQDKIIRRLRTSVRLRNLMRLHPNGRLAASYTLILFSWFLLFRGNALNGFYSCPLGEVCLSCLFLSQNGILNHIYNILLLSCPIFCMNVLFAFSLFVNLHASWFQFCL